MLAGSYYEWCEPAREDLRRRAVDGLCRLAELRDGCSEPEQALAALEKAIEIDRYGEELYRRVMRLQAQMGRTDAVRRSFRLLENRLGDLGVDPDISTRRLAEELLLLEVTPMGAAASP